jgi:hypothetical protein
MVPFTIVPVPLKIDQFASIWLASVVHGELPRVPQSNAQAPGYASMSIKLTVELAGAGSWGTPTKIPAGLWTNVPGPKFKLGSSPSAPLRPPAIKQAGPFIVNCVFVVPNPVYALHWLTSVASTVLVVNEKLIGPLRPSLLVPKYPEAHPASGQIIISCVAPDSASPKLRVHVPDAIDVLGAGVGFGVGVGAACLVALHPHITTDNSRAIQSFFNVCS